MSNFADSGFGKVPTDKVLVSKPLKPIWYLDPVPLGYSIPRPSPLSSLQELCLYKISQDFHYYSVTHLTRLPRSLSKKILDRVKRDRGYTSSSGPRRNPDETTIWMYELLTDQNGVKGHTLVLPSTPTLHHFQPDETYSRPVHPFMGIHDLYQNGRFELLTTITLDGPVVNDDSILNLRYCTHLSILKTKQCRITDTGVSLLSSSIDLNDQKGMIRLRGWFFNGCNLISDKSMRHLIRFPGLVILDMRGTSVTRFGVEIFNRFNRDLYAGRHSDFEKCSQRFKRLFQSAGGSLDKVLTMLCQTLIKRPRSSRRRLRDGRWWIDLHLVLYHKPLETRWSHGLGESTEYDDHQKYIPGIGMIYGHNVNRVGVDDETFSDMEGSDPGWDHYGGESESCEDSCDDEDLSDWDNSSIKTEERKPDVKKEDEEFGQPPGTSRYASFFDPHVKIESESSPGRNTNRAVAVSTPSPNVKIESEHLPRQSTTRAIADPTSPSPKVKLESDPLPRQSINRAIAVSTVPSPKVKLEPGVIPKDDIRVEENHLMLVRTVPPDWQALRWKTKVPVKPTAHVKLALAKKDPRGLIADILGTTGSLIKTEPITTLTGGFAVSSRQSKSSVQSTSNQIGHVQKRRFEGTSDTSEAKRSGMRMFSGAKAS